MTGKYSLSKPPIFIINSLFIFPKVQPVHAIKQDLNDIHLYPSNLSNVLILLSSLSDDEPPQTYII